MLARFSFGFHFRSSESPFSDSLSGLECFEEHPFANVHKNAQAVPAPAPIANPAGPRKIVPKTPTVARQTMPTTDKMKMIIVWNATSRSSGGNTLDSASFLRLSRGAIFSPKADSAENDSRKGVESLLRWRLSPLLSSNSSNCFSIALNAWLMASLAALFSW